MQMPSTFPFFHGPRALRRYRDQLRQAIATEPAFRLLPALATLPLDLAPLPNPRALLQGPAGLALIGVPAAGRTLALLQTLANSEDPNTPSIYLALAEDDAANLPPRAVISGALHRAGLPTSIIDRRRPCVLLLDDFDRLPAYRRALWMTFLQGLAANWPAARPVVALADSAELPDLQPLHMHAPDPAQLAAWLRQLLPDHDPQPILAALDGPLALLRNRLSDLLLLALVYPIGGLPDSRAALYAQAYGLVRPLLEENNGPFGPRIGRATLRHYRLARELAGGADFDLLAELPPDERAAVTPLAAGLLDDPRPVFDLLWRDSDNRSTFRALAACLRERPLIEPGLRLLSELCSGADPALERQLIDVLMPVLPQILAADVDRACGWLPSLVDRAPQPALLLRALVDHPQAPAELRWAAADQLLRLGLTDDWAGAPDAAATAMRCYLLVLASSTARERLLTPELREGTLALMGGIGGSLRRRQAAQAIMADPNAAAELRALALATAPPDNPADQALLSRALRDRDPELRASALAALQSGDSEQILTVIATALHELDGDRIVGRALIDAAAGVDRPEAQGLLVRLVLDASRSVDLRLWALERLAQRGPASGGLLAQLLALPRLTAVVRAAAARQLGCLGLRAAIPALRTALASDVPALVRIAAVTALGRLAEKPAQREAVLAGLLMVLDTPCLDATLTATIARVLGSCGPAALASLGMLLGPDFKHKLRAGWCAAVPALEHTPVNKWPQLDLAESLRAPLMDMLSDGATPADRPGSLDELVQHQAGLVAIAAADGLYELLRQQPKLRREAAGLLRRGLQVQHPPEVLAHLIDRMGDLFGAGALAALLNDRRLEQQVRWLALERLGPCEGCADLLLQWLQAGADDSFTQIRMIELLGSVRFRGALPALRQIAERDDVAPQERKAALGACGMIDDPGAFTTLWRIALDPQEPDRLRAAAIAGLPAELDPASVRMLRTLLQVERVVVELALPIVELLGRLRDRESLALLMRYAQIDAAQVAVAAIRAIVAIGDATVAPTFVRISQNAQAAAAVRVEAVAALLQLCGEEYLPLLRSWLVAPQLPLRMRAYRALAEYCPDDPRLVAPLADTEEALVLRMAALNDLRRLNPSDELPALILTNGEEDLQLRLETVGFLVASGRIDTAERFVATLAMQPEPVLQRRCVDGLVLLAAEEGPAAEAARYHLNTILVTHAVQGRWAAMRLLD
ncbi:MAG: hypothetical protein HC822_26715 [Oscillochloris sp.]|nr:hypothetical protein [Oscillochloris sp.]